MDIRRNWAVLTLYQRFEAFVAFLLTVVVGAVIVVALARLMVSVVEMLILQTLNPLEHSVFQQVFGEIMTLLIALEFNHTLHYVVAGERSIIQVRIVVLIALLALSRKVIVADLLQATPPAVAALGALALSLGITYWLMGDRQDPLLQPRPVQPTPPPATVVERE